MREHVSQFLWTGNARDARDPRLLHETGVEAVVDLAYEEPPAAHSRSLITIRIPLTDGSENSPDHLRLAIETVVSLQRKQLPTLIACSAGMSRSPSVTAAALSILEQRSPQECLERITEGNPCDISPGLWDSLLSVLEELAFE